LEAVCSPRSTLVKCEVRRLKEERKRPVSFPFLPSHFTLHTSNETFQYASLTNFDQLSTRSS
jgi:hypothetical protein